MTEQKLPFKKGQLWSSQFGPILIVETLPERDVVYIYVNEQGIPIQKELVASHTQLLLEESRLDLVADVEYMLHEWMKLFLSKEAGYFTISLDKILLTTESIQQDKTNTNPNETIKTCNEKKLTMHVLNDAEKQKRIDLFNQFMLPFNYKLNGPLNKQRCKHFKNLKKKMIQEKLLKDNYVYMLFICWLLDYIKDQSFEDREKVLKLLDFDIEQFILSGVVLVDNLLEARKLEIDGSELFMKEKSNLKQLYQYYASVDYGKLSYEDVEYLELPISRELYNLCHGREHKRAYGFSEFNSIAFANWPCVIGQMSDFFGAQDTNRLVCVFCNTKRVWYCAPSLPIQYDMPLRSGPIDPYQMIRLSIIDMPEAIELVFGKEEE